MQLRWLPGVLAARRYPLENLADNLRTGAGLLERLRGESAQVLAARLAAAADGVGSG